MASQKRSRWSRLRARIFGDDRNIGLWILPLFVMAALLGAVLIGGLSALYYGQQASDLKETTAAARRGIDTVVDDVRTAAQRARRDITRQANRARDELSRESPVAGPTRAGVYSISATHPDGEVRVASAFTVFSNQEETFLLTNYAVVATDNGGAVDSVDVFLPDGAVSIPVYSIDRERDLSILVGEGGPLPVLPWRPSDEPVSLGDAIYAVGVAGADTPAVLEGQVAGASAMAIVPNLPLNAFLAGGPLVDGSGRVVGIASQDYAPFGEVEGDLVYAPPIRMACEVLIDCTAADVGAEGLTDPEAGAGPTAQPPEG